MGRARVKLRLFPRFHPPTRPFSFERIGALNFR